MRIITYNINGIRSAIKKGFIDWLSTNPADIICLQEVKAHLADIDVTAIEATGYKTHWFCAQKKGYSGVGILTKIEPSQVVCGSGIAQSDLEGRVMYATFNGITVVNAYFPSGTTGDVRQTYKYLWLNEFLAFVSDLKQSHNKIVICGDYNIAHKEIDIHNPKGNKNASGFLPEERAWFDKFLANGFVDAFRVINKEPHQYTWWYQLRPSIREENKGWRIDYISVTETLSGAITHAAIYPMVKHSDHCPVYVELMHV